MMPSFTIVLVWNRLLRIWNRFLTETAIAVPTERSEGRDPYPSHLESSFLINPVELYRYL
jgi:hypothetical protein